MLKGSTSGRSVVCVPMMPKRVATAVLIPVLLILTRFGDARAPPGLEGRSKPTTLNEARQLHVDALQATDLHMMRHGHQHRPSASVGRVARTDTARTVSYEGGSDGAGQATPISPVDFGADPTGETDSTNAFEAAMAALTNTSSRASVPMASGIANLGGATLDLGGGEYLIGKPLIIPAFVGNVRIRGGTLRATASFPPARFLIEVGDTMCKAKDGQGVCNEFVAVEDIFLDGSHVAAGGVLVALTMGTTIGPSAFVTGFTQAGIRVEQGHETIVLDAWIAEYFWSEKHPGSEACNHSSGQPGSIGVHLVGEDNYVENTIVFDFTCLGVLVDGAATLLNGVHSWNGGGVAILINGSYDIQV